MKAFVPKVKQWQKIIKLYQKLFFSCWVNQTGPLDSRWTLSPIVRCHAWHYGSRKELWHCWDWAYYQDCFKYRAQLSSKWAAAAHNGSLFAASWHCARKLLSRLCVGVVTGGVKHEVICVRWHCSTGTAASLALLGPDSIFFYIPALQMGEITGLAKSVCVCEEHNQRPWE